MAGSVKLPSCVTEEKRPYELCTEGAGLALTTEEGVDLLVEVQVVLLYWRSEDPHPSFWWVGYEMLCNDTATTKL